MGFAQNSPAARMKKSTVAWYGTARYFTYCVGVRPLMGQEVKDHLRRALSLMFKPLVRLLIAQGVTHAEFSETAKEVLKLAEKFAQEDNLEFVGTEHILLAIMENGLGVGAQVLINASISISSVKDQISRLTRQSREDTWVFGRLPGTPHFKQVVACAIEEAERLKDTKVGTEYLLLGLMRETGCVAERSLRNLGLNLELARKEVARLQGRLESDIPS